VVAAIGASGLTGAVGFGTIWWQQRHIDDRKAIGKKELAYRQLIAHSLSFSIRASALRNAMEMRSGLAEGMNVVTGIRRALDPLEFHDWLAQGFAPINEAWSTIEVIGIPEAVLAATKLVDACADLVGVATQAGQARGKAATAVKGLSWTSEQQNALETATQRVTEERQAFIRLAREETGTDAVVPRLEQAQPDELTSATTAPPASD
jgi:hypothetical protein